MLPLTIYFTLKEICNVSALYLFTFNITSDVLCYVEFIIILFLIFVNTSDVYFCLSIFCTKKEQIPVLKSTFFVYFDESILFFYHLFLCFLKYIRCIRLSLFFFILLTFTQHFHQFLTVIS